MTMTSKLASQITPNDVIIIGGKMLRTRYLRYHARKVELSMQPFFEPLSPYCENDIVSLTVPVDFRLETWAKPLTTYLFEGKVLTGNEWTQLTMPNSPEYGEMESYCLSTSGLAVNLYKDIYLLRQTATGAYCFVYADAVAQFSQPYRTANGATTALFEYMHQL